MPAANLVVCRGYVGLTAPVFLRKTVIIQLVSSLSLLRMTLETERRVRAAAGCLTVNSQSAVYISDWLSFVELGGD